MIIYISVLLCFLFLSVPACPRSYSFRSLSTSEGLSDLWVNSIYKDARGYVWLGTGNTMERFDGVHVKCYPIPGADEKLKRVNVIAETDNETLWMGNGMGLWRMNRAKDVWEPVARETINYAVRSLLYDGAETLYIGTDKGLYIYRSGHLENVLVDSNVLSPSNSIAGLDMGEDQLLWMATGKGLYSLSLFDGKITAYQAPLEASGYAFSHVTRIGKVLYLGTTDRGIICFDTRCNQFSPFVSVGCPNISSLSSDGKDVLYVGTDGNGVHFISVTAQKVIRSMRHEPGKEGDLRSNSVYSLLVDREGLIWIGFYQLGVDYTLYQSDMFATYAYSPWIDTKDMTIRALAIRGHEKLIGSRDGLFYVNEQTGQFKSFRVPQLRANMVFSCLYYHDEYYIGTYKGGLYIFNPATLTLRDFDASGNGVFSNGDIFCLKTDYEGNLWIGTSQGVFCYKDGKQTAHYTHANSRLPDGNVYEIFFDSTHKGWICTENGLCLWEPSTRTLKSEVFPEGFVHKEKIRVVYEDSNHELYFFPDKGPLFVSNLSMTVFRRLPPGTPIEGTNGLFIIEDKENWLWLGSSNGLFRYDKKETFLAYDFVDGIPNPVFTLCPPVMDEKGSIWFGNSKGLLSLDVSQANRGKSGFYPMAVTSVYVNGKSEVPIYNKEGEDAEVILSPSQRNLTLLLSDFSYTDPNAMSYQYMLSGEEDDWVVLKGGSKVDYYDLSPGVYTFKVRRNGNPESEVRMTIRIGGGRMWWLVFVAVVAGLAGCLYVFRRKRHQPAISVEEPKDAVPALAARKYRTNQIPEEECKRLAEKLEALMREHKPYANPDLKIADLAAAVGTTSHNLSYLFSQYLKRSYHDYITSYRIEEFKRMVVDGDYDKYTVTALGELCGFSSKASFYRLFKEITGMSPSEYVRSVGKHNK